MPGQKPLEVVTATELKFCNVGSQRKCVECALLREQDISGANGGSTVFGV